MIDLREVYVMANIQNLLHDGPCKYTSETAKAANLKSQEAKKRKKQLRECLEILMEKDFTGPDGKNISGAEAISVKLFQQAMKGNIKAFEMIRDTVGQKPIDKIMVAEVDPEVMREVEDVVLGTTAGMNIPAGSILQCDKVTGDTIKVFRTVADAAAELGMDKSNINKCVRGKLKSAGGFVWRQV
jgi:hypothetical protein